MSLQQSRASLMMMGLLSAVVGLSACQKQSEPEPTLNEKIEADQDIAMSAEPAEPNDPAINDPSAAEVAQDTVANVETPVAEVAYVCNPELKLNALYNDDANSVTLTMPEGEITLQPSGDGAYEAATAIDGKAGITQWRVAHGQEQRASGVLRTTMGEGSDVTAYECNASGS